jgi:hypothetical protein
LVETAKRRSSDPGVIGMSFFFLPFRLFAVSSEFSA